MNSILTGWLEIKQSPYPDETRLCAGASCAEILRATNLFGRFEFWQIDFDRVSPRSANIGFSRKKNNHEKSLNYPEHVIAKCITAYLFILSDEYENVFNRLDAALNSFFSNFFHTHTRVHVHTRARTFVWTSIRTILKKYWNKSWSLAFSLY